MSKLPKEERDRIIEMIHLNGNAPSEWIVNTLMSKLEIDPKAAKEQYARRYLGQLLRTARDGTGARTMFMDRKSGNVIDMDTCDQRSMLIAVSRSLQANIRGNMRSLHKATRRIAELDGQIGMFDGSAYDLSLEPAKLA